MPEPLIPDDVRELYEQLIEEGRWIVPDSGATSQDPRVHALLKCGLAIELPMPPSSLLVLPVSPEAAFERTLARWQRGAKRAHRKFAYTPLTATRLQRLASRTAVRRRMGSRAVTLIKKPHVPSLHNALADAGDRIIRAISTGPYGETLTTGPQYFGPTADFRDSGGRTLVLCDQEMVERSPGNVISGHEDGEEIRVVPEKLPIKLQIVDNDSALVPLGPYGHPALLIRDSQLVAAFTRFFDLKWAEATPWAPPGTQQPPKADPARQRILDALAAGLKDEAIARQLGISARTVRRHIAAIMDELGAPTRFAAGVAAVRRGWVPRAA